MLLQFTWNNGDKRMKRVVLRMLKITHLFKIEGGGEGLILLRGSEFFFLRHRNRCLSVCLRVCGGRLLLVGMQPSPPRVGRQPQLNFCLPCPALIISFSIISFFLRFFFSYVVLYFQFAFFIPTFVRVICKLYIPKKWTKYFLVLFYMKSPLIISKELCGSQFISVKLWFNDLVS